MEIVTDMESRMGFRVFTPYLVTVFFVILRNFLGVFKRMGEVDYTFTCKVVVVWGFFWGGGEKLMLIRRIKMIWRIN